MVKNELYEVSYEFKDGALLDLNNYDLVLNPENYDPCEDEFGINIEVRDENGLKRIFIYDFYANENEERVILENDVLVVLLGESINAIGLSEMKQIYHRELNEFGVSSDIYRIEKGYIIHHETSIIMLNFDLEEVWSVDFGEVTISSEEGKDFMLYEDFILVYDFDNYYYHISYDGDIIETDNPDVEVK